MRGSLFCCCGTAGTGIGSQGDHHQLRRRRRGPDGTPCRCGAQRGRTDHWHSSPLMEELEWGHQKLTELVLVNDMHERKRAMLERADAVVALPGGCGTLEELFEAITWKRLGLYLGPIVLVNVQGFFDPCIELLERCVEKKFMDARHLSMWKVVENPYQVIEAVCNASPWAKDCRRFAVPGL